jgi:hypothetical protein
LLLHSLEFFKTNFIEEQLIVNLVLVLAFFFYYGRKSYLTSFFGSKNFFLVADGRFFLRNIWW